MVHFFISPNPHQQPQKRYAPYRQLGMEHTGICGMGHTTSEDNNTGMFMLLA